MANVPSVTAMCAPQPLYASAMNAPSATIRTSASFAAEKESRTLSTVLSARGWRKIGMAARRSSTWEVRGQICFTRRRISGIIKAAVLCPVATQPIMVLRTCQLRTGRDAGFSLLVLNEMMKKVQHKSDDLVRTSNPCKR